MNEKNNLFSATGIPSLFLIFGVLMLVILSLLGYGTSRQDQSASALSLEQTTAYYDACTEATDFYTDTQTQLEGFAAQADTEEEYYQLASDYFAKTADATWNPAEHTIQYVKAFSETQSLVVKMSVLWSNNITVADTDTAINSLVQILTWNTVVTADWNPDNSQSVYKGE